MRKRPVFKKTKTIIFLVLVYTVTLGIGLALFSENIHIEGTANTLTYECDESLNVTLTKLDLENNRYTIGDIPPRVIIEDEYLVENELFLVYRAIHRNSPANRVTNLSFKLNNTYPFVLSEGETYVTYSSQNNNLFNVNSYLSLNTVPIGSDVTVSVSFNTRLNNLSEEVSTTIKIEYIVNECHKYFYFHIILLPML